MVYNMAFEYVDTSSLRNALTECKNKINYNKTKELISDISKNNVWQARSKDVLSKALQKLKDKRYKELEDKINNYLSLVTDIEKYQSLASENKSLKNEYSSLSSKLYYTETYTDSNGAIITETKKDLSVQSQMNSILSQINKNKDKMKTLENKVSSSIKKED